MSYEHTEADAPFFALDLSRLAKNDCSPDLPDAKFAGIRIAMPSRAPFAPGRHGVVPLCGRYRLPVKRRPYETILMGFVLQAVATSDGAVYSANLMEPDPVEPDPDADDGPSDADLEGMSVGGYFNADVWKYLGLPTQPDTYEVSVALEDEYRSNVVTIELVEVEDLDAADDGGDDDDLETPEPEPDDDLETPEPEPN